MDTAQHYRGSEGRDYFAYQEPIGKLGATLNRTKFLPYVTADATVVDFGCGAGGLLAGLPALERIGIEVSQPARAAATARGLRTVASARELDDGVADVVISNHALEHTTAPLDELRDLRRILKPGGRLVLWVPLDDWRTQRRPNPADVNHHLYTWTPLLLANLLGEAGFTVETVQVVTSAWPPLTRLVMRLPSPAFEAIARCWAMARRRRQVRALAHA